MKKWILAALITALALAGCGGSNTGSASSNVKKHDEPTWTVAMVEKDFNDQITEDIAADGDSLTVETSCILESGSEGKQGKLRCHVEYSDDDTYTVEIIVPPNGHWISNGI